MAAVGLSAMWVWFTLDGTLFGRQIAAAFTYTAAVPLFILLPGRGTPGYNPFGPEVRRVWRPLLTMHAVCTVIFVAGVSAAAWLRPHLSLFWTHGSGSRHSTRFGTAGCLAILVLVSVQGIRSSLLLSDAEEALAAARRGPRTGLPPAARPR